MYEFDQFDRKNVDENLAIREQAARTAVYIGKCGDLIIRQSNWPDEDDVVIVARNNVEALVRAILAEAEIELQQQPSVPSPKPVDATGASRSRRYRQRHGVTPTPSRDDRDGSRDDAAPPLTLVAAE